MITVLLSVWFLLIAGCASATSVPLTPPPGVELIPAPASGEKVHIDLGFSKMEIKFPLWDGKEWEYRAVDGSYSWLMEVSVRFTSVASNGNSRRVAVIELSQPDSPGHHPGRRHECWYSSDDQKLIKCQIDGRPNLSF